MNNNNVGNNVTKSRSMVSFGSVETLEYQVTSHARSLGDIRNLKRNNISVEDFERCRYDNGLHRKRNKRRVTAGSQQELSLEDVSRRLKQLRLRIEHTMQATGTPINPNRATTATSIGLCQANNSFVNTPISFTSTTNTRPPRTGSLTRVPTALNGATSGFANVTPWSSFQDSAPKRPTRKYDNDCASRMDGDGGDEKIQPCRWGGPSATANATWDLPLGPAKRSGPDSLSLTPRAKEIQLAFATKCSAILNTKVISPNNNRAP